MRLRFAASASLSCTFAGMTVTDIKTDVFNRIVKELRSEGWKPVEEYDNMDAWID
jgi:hypothetical protein